MGIKKDTRIRLSNIWRDDEIQSNLKEEQKRGREYIGAGESGGHRCPPCCEHTKGSLQKIAAMGIHGKALCGASHQKINPDYTSHYCLLCVQLKLHTICLVCI